MLLRNLGDICAGSFSPSWHTGRVFAVNGGALHSTGLLFTGWELGKCSFEDASKHSLQQQRWFHGPVICRRLQVTPQNSRPSWWHLGAVRCASLHEVLANGDIPFPFVRVVDDHGLVGDFFLAAARALAKEKDTDLVVLSGEVHPPLCRLVKIENYLEELSAREDALQKRKLVRLLQEYSFDPALKVKGMQFTAMVHEHDLERKLNQVRGFIDKGHRVQARVLQGRCPPEDVIDLALRIVAEVRDIAKPENFEQSIRDFQNVVTQPLSLKKSPKGKQEELNLRLWPCTPEQAAAFKLPANVLGPRRRRGPAIVGIDDDPELMKGAWRMNRKEKPFRISLKEFDW